MKRNIFVIFGIIAMAAVLTLAGCDNGSTDDKTGGGGGDPDLIGKWYDTQVNADADGAAGLVLQFESSGESWSASGNEFTMTENGVNVTATYSISGTVLTVTNATLPMFNGTYYRKA